MQDLSAGIVDDAIAVLAALRKRAPRVQCLTNTVAQQITANVLLAAGARVSMATHPAEVVAMTASADAVLFNLGTIDAARIEAIPGLLDDARVRALPRVLDPVFVEHSPLRMALALRIIAAGPLIVKGNAAELAALPLPPSATRVKTGATDWISRGDKRCDGESDSVQNGEIWIANGHAWMAEVTGLGCALGGLIAACAAVEPDAVVATTAAVLAFGVCGELAARTSAGPGTFTANFIDAIAGLNAAKLRSHARVGGGYLQAGKDGLLRTQKT